MARTRQKPPRAVSANNPCPFLRALVAQGLLKDGQEPLTRVARTVARVAASGDGEPRLPALAIHAIAAIAHGLLPWQVAQTQLRGLRLNGLRDGPLDKHGVGSRILDAHGEVDLRELARLDDFAADQRDAQGREERGLGSVELKRFMDANFERARHQRRVIDRKLMDGEWPVLLKVMGKDGERGRYLALDELHQLICERKLPQRMLDRLQPAPG
jgi:hypothetical protein